MNTEILPLFSVGFERKGFSNKNFHIHWPKPSASVFYNQLFGRFLARVRTLFFETDYFVHGN